LSKSYIVGRPCRLRFDVVEQFGKNMEFGILQDGLNIYSSGVFTGKGGGEVLVKAGVISVNLKNDSLLESKSGSLYITAVD
jgi:hypothetical protein